jgi:hypothetical protein
MNFTGKIIAILPARSGIGKNSGKEWRSQDFVVEDASGRFVQSFVFSLFNKDLPAAVGDEVEVTFDARAKEWQGRWFNSLEAFSVNPISRNPATSESRNDIPQERKPENPNEKDDDLPF